MHIVVVADKTAGACKLYFNGENVTSVSTLRTDYATTSIARIGLDFANNGDLFAFMDDIQVYDATLTFNNVDSMWNNPGNDVRITGCGDPPIPSDSVTVLLTLDWDNFTVTTTHGANVPTGIWEDSLEANIPTHYNLDSDDAWNPYFADNADIVVFDGSKVLKSWYLQGQCCTGANVDKDISDGGTGIDEQFYITGISDYYTEVYLSYNVYLMPGFDNSAGFKMPGIKLEKDNAYSKLMIVPYLGVDMEPQYFTRAYWNGVDLSTHFNTKTIGVPTAGAWHNITLRLYAGTSGNADGLVEMSWDGVYVGQKVPDVPFVISGEPSGFSYVSFSTFMGGNTTSYDSPQDQWILFDDVVIWYYNDGADVVHGSEGSGLGRDITSSMPDDCNWPR